MIMNHKELLGIYKNDIVIKKMLADKKLMKIDKSLYTTKKDYSEFEYILKKYNNFIFTMETALFIWGYKNINLNKYSIATKRKAKVIKSEVIKQYFMPDNLYELGLETIEYNGYKIKIYDKERILLEIIKNKEKIDYNLYIKIIEDYRSNITHISISKIYEYIK